MDQLIGKVLHNRYCIQSLLDRQTGRRTLLANDLQTGLSVVVKLLLFGPDFTWDDLKLFEREAEVLKALDHPAIPKYLDYFQVEAEPGKGFALVQTYIEARSLQDWMQSGRTFSEEELKVIAKKLLEILDYLHCRQPPVIHRDIKPSNILLGDRSGNSPGQMYLIDFGSVQTAMQSGTRTIVGTYGYMPPEQFGGQTTPTSDLYALGATLIYLATGQHPGQLPQREMRLLFEDRVNLSPYFIDWLQWITEPSMDLRLKSAKQALEALETSSLREHSLAVATKPFGSKVQVTNTRQMLEILIPPCGFNPGLIPAIGFAIMWNSVIVAWCDSIALATWNYAACLFQLAFFGTLLSFGLQRIWVILLAFLGKERLRITQSEISQSWEIFGLRCWHLMANRQNITKVELIRLSYEKDLENGTSELPPKIIIWAGRTKFTLGNEHNLTYKYNLTVPELDWLAQNLSSWLNLSITKP